MIPIDLLTHKLDEYVCVYRYTDMSDGIIKYVGIVYKGTIANRHKTHTREDWYIDGQFLVEYIVVKNRSEAEAIESHLISLYGTDKYYNKAKAGWGINSFLPTEYQWKPIIVEFDDLIKELHFKVCFYEECNKKQMYTSTVQEFIDGFYYIEKVNAFLNDKHSLGGIKTNE